jgi:hypothetical protein
MASLENVTKRIFSDDRFLVKWLLGGVICMIPILNIVALGYWLRHARRMLRAGDVTPMPEWEDWKELFFDGLRLLLLKLVYVGIPFLLALFLSWLLMSFFNMLHMGVFAYTVALIPVAIVLAAGPLFLCSGIFHFLKTGTFDNLLQFNHVIRTVVRALPTLILPMLAYWGLALLGWPLGPFTFFLGFGLLLSYSMLAFIES